MPSSPAVSLASSVHAGPGTFALLVGSGVSREARVLTGWDVTLDLIRRLAAALRQDPGEDLIGWYRSHSGGEPDYSSLLEDLAPSREDRRSLLERYFEPTDDERDEGAKIPTAAHRAIADLVKGGYVKVIVTTNFDRLLELALAEVGVVPAVISSPAHAEGALPLVPADARSSRCTATICRRISRTPLKSSTAMTPPSTLCWTVSSTNTG